MDARGLLGDEQPLPDLPVGEAGRHQGEDLPLARCQAEGRLGRGDPIAQIDASHRSEGLYLETEGFGTQSDGGVMRLAKSRTRSLAGTPGGEQRLREAQGCVGLEVGHPERVPSIHRRCPETGVGSCLQAARLRITQGSIGVREWLEDGAVAIDPRCHPMDRFDLHHAGPLPLLAATPNKNGKVGIYEASTGVSDGLGRATWNYDWHVDLRGARGVARGTTLGDYDLTLETDISSTDTLFGLPVPLDLTFGGAAAPADTVLYQQSFNPKFGNPSFDSSDPGHYHFRLVLTPKTFHGPEIAVAIRVDVS